MFRRRRNATHSLYTNNFDPSSILAMLIFWLSILHATRSTEIQSYEISPFVGPSLPTTQASRFSMRRTVENDSKESLSLHDIVRRLNVAAILRGNMLTSIGRILLLRLDEESRIVFEEIYESLRTRHVPSYNYLSLVPLIQGKMSKEQLQPVLQLMERIGTPYISSYAMMCLESLSDGRVNLDATSATDLLLGIDNSTRNSLAMDKHRKGEVPFTLEEAVSTVMKSVADDLIEPDLELVAALMLNIPDFDFTNPEVPETIRYVARYMKENSKPGDPILEYLSGEDMSGPEKLVKVILERILISESASSVLREAVGLLLQNFRVSEEGVTFRMWNTTDIFNVVAPDFYPRSVVAIAKYFQRNLGLLYDPVTDLSSYTTELQALGAVIRQISRNSSLSEPVRETATTLGSFIAQKQREEDPQHSLEYVNVHRALEYLTAFRSLCLPKKLRIAAKRLQPYMDDKLPWNYTFGDTRLRRNPYELVVNALIRLKNIDVSKELGRALDDFIYQAEISRVTGKRNVLYDQEIIFQREDTDLVDLDVHSLLARLPGVFRDERFAPMLSFFSRQNLIDYLGRGFNMFAHTNFRAILINLIKVASDKPAVRKNEELYKALRVSMTLLEEPTIENKYTSEELQNILKALPGIDDDPRYLPIKLLFKKEYLFRYISHSFSLAGLETSSQHIALVLNTVNLKPIDKRLEDSIIFTLTNLEGPQLPARSFIRDDFTYLVSHLLRRDKKVASAILESDVYESVSEWNITVSGTPEDVLARTLSYAAEKLSSSPKISAIVDKAVKILEEEAPRKVKLLDKKILGNMLKYLPDSPDLKPVNLLLNKANLAMFLQPHMNVSTLSKYPPRKALVVLLKRLMSSPYLKRETLLRKRLKATLQHVGESADPSTQNMSSEKIYNDVDFDTSQVIGDNEIREVVSLLPDEPMISPLKKLLTPSWIRDILPQDFRSVENPSKEQIMRIILFLTKQRPEVMENSGLMAAISSAEQSLVSWKRDILPLRKIVHAVKNTLYDPMKQLMRPEFLNQLNLSYHFNFKRTPKQLMVGLIHKLMLNRRINASDSQVMHVLNGLRQDVLDFGLDSDLLWVLDDAGIPHRPSLAPVRLFLHTTMATSRLGRRIIRITDPEERFQILMNSLLADKLVHADKELLKSVHELAEIEPSFKNPLKVTEADVRDIIDALPDEVVKGYPEIQKLFGHETLIELPSYSEILDSGQPVMTLLRELSRLPKVVGNQELSAEMVELRKALGDFVHQPVISSYNLRPLLRELNHAKQLNADYIVNVIKPKMLSVLLPKGFDDSDKIQDDGELLNNILNKVLSQNVFDNDEELKKHVSSIQRDLVTISMGRKNKVVKELFSDQEVKKMLKLVPKSAKFNSIRSFIKTEYGLDKVLELNGSREYSMPLRLMKTLDFVEKHSKKDDYLHDSVIALKAHLIRQYFFVSENDVKMLTNEINKLSDDSGLVPLRLFLTVENLVKYLPSDIEFGRFKSPQEALNVVLHILRYNKKLKTNTMLQKSMAVAVAAVRAAPSGRRMADGNVEGTEKHQLTIYDLRFTLNLNLKNSFLKYYLKPSILLRVLPRSFSFASKTTFKAKVLHLLNYMLTHNMGPIKEISQTVQNMIQLNDLPDIKNTDVQRLIAAIDDRVIGSQFKVIKNYLTIHNLLNIVPGDFHIGNNSDVRETLVQLVKIVLYSLSEGKSKEMIAFEILLSELQNPLSPIIKKKAKTDPAGLKSLIEEIPYKTCENTGNLRQDLTVEQVLYMLPENFELESFETRKLALLKVLEIVKEHRDASGFKKSVEAAEKCVENMQDIPRITPMTIYNLLNSSDLDKQDVITLTDNCKTSNLTKYLPISFNIDYVKSTRGQFQAIIDTCQKLKHENSKVDKALKNARIFMEKLPLADFSKFALRSILKEICCCNFTTIKPFIVLAATDGIVPLLPLTLRMDKEPTFKHKLLALLKFLRNLDTFKSGEMLDALNAAEEDARAMRDKPILSEKDIEDLKKLPVMMAPTVKYFADVFTMPNLLKVVPPSFDRNNYVTPEPRLAHLIKYSRHIVDVIIDPDCAESWDVAEKWLTHDAEEETLDYIEDLVRYDDELKSLMLNAKAERERGIFFKNVRIPHGYEYEDIEDRIRVVLRHKLRVGYLAWFKEVTKSMELLLSNLSVVPPNDYEILQAINEIPDTRRNRVLKIHLRCKDVMDRALGLQLNPEHTLKRLILDILTLVESTAVSEEVSAAIAATIPAVERAMWGEEIDESLKQIPNFKVHMGKLSVVRSYYTLHGPVMILGPDYHAGSSGKLELLKKLVDTLLPSPDLDKDKELETGIEYLNEVLTNPEKFAIPKRQKTIQDIDIKSMLSVLPKIRSEKIIFGLLKFFTDPKLSDTIGATVDPSKFDSQGSLMKKIIDFGIKLDKVKKDPNQLKALKYVKNKIRVTGIGGLPIKLKSSSKYSTITPDLMGLLKSVDIHAANLSNVMPIAKFFDTEYDPLIHGRGFDHQAYSTRGTYLKAFLEHLIANADVQHGIKKHAKVLVNFVKLDGPGAEPFDVDVDTTLENRIFHSELSRGPNSYGWQSADVSAHFEIHPQDPWEKVSTVELARKSLSDPSPFGRLMEKDNEPSPLFEEERSSLITSINRILNSNRRTREAPMFDPESVSTGDEGDDNLLLDLVGKGKTLNGIQNDSPSVSQKQMKLSKREAREDVSAASQLGDEEPLYPETATFSPDKILVDVETRLVKGPLKIEPDDGAYITEEEAEKRGRKKHDPVQPLIVDQDELPAETDSENGAIPHTLSKNPGKIDLVSRKLFIRNDTDPSLIRKHRDLSGDISIQDHKYFGHENKTVKKDLSQSSNAKYLGLPSDFQGETAVVDTGVVTNSLPVAEPLTLQRSTDISNTENPGPSVVTERITSEDQKSSDQLTDDITVEELNTHVVETSFDDHSQVVAVEQDNTGIIESSAIPDVNDAFIDTTEGVKKMIPQRVSIEYDYVEPPIVAIARVTPNGNDYGRHRQPVPKIEEMYTESIKRRRSTDYIIPMMEASGDVSNAVIQSRKKIFYDVAHMSKRDLEARDSSHLKWEGHYMAGRKR